jgi:hypothetical protein
VVHVWCPKMGKFVLVTELENDSLGETSLQVSHFLPLLSFLPALLQGKQPLGIFGGLGKFL